jgi:hypothetical protein
MTLWQICNDGRDDDRPHGRRGLRRHVLASAVAALLIVAGGVGHALAQEDDDDELPDTKFLRGMMHGLGLKKDGEQSGINYQERAPLVVPPTRDLPPPQSADMARGNTDWPVDQDEKRRKDAAAARRKASRTTWEDLSRQLSPNELKAGATTAKDEALSRRSAQTPEEYQTQYKPSQLGYVGGMFGGVKSFFTGNNEPESTTFEAEPPRASLTDPPVGYRSPSPAEPYGVGQNAGKTKAMTEEDRVNVGAGSTAH